MPRRGRPPVCKSRSDVTGPAVHLRGRGQVRPAGRNRESQFVVARGGALPPAGSLTRLRGRAGTGCFRPHETKAGGRRGEDGMCRSTSPARAGAAGLQGLPEFRDYGIERLLKSQSLEPRFSELGLCRWRPRIWTLAEAPGAPQQVGIRELAIAGSGFSRALGTRGLSRPHCVGRTAPLGGAAPRPRTIEGKRSGAAGRGAAPGSRPAAGCHPLRRLKGRSTQTSGISVPRLERPRSPDPRVRAKGPSGGQRPLLEVAGVRHISPGGTLEAERLEPRVEAPSIPYLEHREIRTTGPHSQGPGILAPEACEPEVHAPGSRLRASLPGDRDRAEQEPGPAPARRGRLPGRRGAARGRAGGGGGAARLNNEGACRRASAAPAGSGTRAGEEARGRPGRRDAAGWRRDPCKGVEAQGQGPSAQPSAGEGAVCRTLASGPPASALPWDPAASRPQLFPALPLALRSSQSVDVPRIPEPGAGAAGLWLLRLLLSSHFFVSTFPSSFPRSLLFPLSVTLSVVLRPVSGSRRSLSGFRPVL
ncbi:PREDICTED: translation initiation factor IF-2-like [Chinchilla lanigera]|uniref:translation initiation factor IF-2-like n=1 Tax=Chinchilla lanigera TaxID=34839 RepID=UPI000698A73D|nr:PREDICTED: translation initiation factor IF-2-like [Chinchilla lanigera]